MKTAEQWEEELDYGAGRLREPDREHNHRVILQARAEIVGHVLLEVANFIEGQCVSESGDELAAAVLKMRIEVK